MPPELELTVSEFVVHLLTKHSCLLTRLFVVVGELVNFRVSKGQWVYFDLKDEAASVKCFGTVFSTTRCT